MQVAQNNPVIQTTSSGMRTRYAVWNSADLTNCAESHLFETLQGAHNFKVALNDNSFQIYPVS